MTALEIKIRNRNERLKKQAEATGQQPSKFITITEYCEEVGIKPQDMVLDDYVNFWFFCRKFNLIGFGTEADDIEEAFIKLRKIIDRNQELLIF